MRAGLGFQASTYAGTTRAAILILLGLVSLLAGCSGQSSGPSTGSVKGQFVALEAQSTGGARRAPAKVGLILPLGGDAQDGALAQAMRRAAEMAARERGAGTIELLVRDDRGSADGARTAADTLIREGAEIILGPLYARAVAAAAPVVRQKRVSMVAFSSDRRAAGDGVYLLSFMPSQEVQRLVDHATAQGRRRFAALVPDDAYGRAVESLLTGSISRSGATLAAIERYPMTGVPLDPARRLGAVLKGAGGTAAIDALIVPSSGDHFSAIAAMVQSTGLDRERVALFGIGAWDYPASAMDTRLRGIRLAVPDPKGWREFAQRYMRAHQQMPPRLTALAYDGLAMAVDLAAGAGSDRFSATAIMRPRGFTGIDGRFRFLADGTAERSLAILEMGPAGAQIVDAAPSGFEAERTTQVMALPPVN